MQSKSSITFLMQELNAFEKPILTIFNKMDLGLVNSSGQLLSPDSFYVPLSAKTGEGVDALEKRLSDIGRELVESGEHGGLSSRCLQPLESAENHIRAVTDTLRRREIIAPEIISLELRNALSYLEEITGEKVDEGILDRIFERFCVGK